ncbi:MAG: T9SS type A sorting domain-containing protein [Caldithrix sp.]|nr:T9SS type A sorting domain-containing protein [Caldithrix sp.]
MSVKIMITSVFIFLMIQLKLQSNPVIAPFISELKVDSADFVLEINAEYFFRNSFDGCYITSLCDTVAIDSGIVLVDSSLNIIDDYVTLTPNVFNKDLQFNTQSDVISFGGGSTDENNQLHFDSWDQIRYGKVDAPYIDAPRAQHSICMSVNNNLYYLDESPTLGQKNDDDEPTGCLHGYIVDSSEAVQPNFSFMYVYGHTRYATVTTDANGYFCIDFMAVLVSLHLMEDGHPGPFLRSQQIYPGDTMRVEVNKDHFTGMPNSREPHVLQDFRLEQNYPNPFNNQTVISYYLPLSDFIELSVFDIAGHKIETLDSGYKKRGRHQIQWKADRYASGVYVYHLVTSLGMLSQK